MSVVNHSYEIYVKMLRYTMIKSLKPVWINNESICNTQFKFNQKETKSEITGIKCYRWTKSIYRYENKRTSRNLILYEIQLLHSI
jgi:hypothetical protein